MNKNKLVLILVIFLLILLEKKINLHNYYYQDLKNVNKPFFYKTHLLGTDYLGRDLLARLSEGILVSFIILFFVCITIIFFSTLLAYFMSYYGKLLDNILMFVFESFLSLPSIILSIFILIFFGNNFILLIFSLSFSRILRMSILIRNEIRKLKTQDYIILLKNMGAKDKYIFKVHILPSIFDFIILKMNLMIPSILFSEVFLSFMGIGIKLPRASLGNIISNSFYMLTINPSIFILSSSILLFIVYVLDGIYEVN